MTETPSNERARRVRLGLALLLLVVVPLMVSTLIDTSPEADAPVAAVSDARRTPAAIPAARRAAIRAAANQVTEGPSSRADSGAPDVVSVNVRSAHDGSPVAGAMVSVIAPDAQVVAQASTQADGSVVFESQALPLTLVVAASGFETAFVDAELETRVKLEGGAALSGRAVLRTGGAPRRPVRVVAIPLSGGSLTGGDGALAAAGHPRFLATMTDAEGRFRIEGLRPGARVRLIAGGGGYVTDAMGQALEGVADGPPVDVVVSPAYLLRVRIVEADGSTPAVSPRLADGAVTWTTQGRHHGFHPADSFHARLVGVEASDPQATGPFDSCGVIVAEEDLERWGPVHLAVRVPGYASAEADAYAERVDAPRREPTLVLVTRNRGGSGTIVVDLAASSESAALAFAGPIARCDVSGFTLYLRSESESFQIDLRDVFSDRVRLSGIPAGAYRAAVVAPSMPPGSVELSPSEISVSDGGLTELVVSVDRWSGVDLRPRFADAATDYRGPLTATVVDLDSNGVVVHGYAGPPYRIGPMSPGRYQVQVAAAGIASEWIPLQTTEGRILETAVQLRRPGGR